ncbi:MAG: UDP-glucose 4-epimerase GalE [Marinilabiliales bacterium]
MSKKILVTGGTGYIGSHAAVELLSASYDIIIADNLSNSEASVINRIKQITGKSFDFIKVDLCDITNTDKLFDNNPDIIAVMHFAAYKSVSESVQNPLKYYYNNINALINVLRNMKRKKINNLIFSSSCTVYGQPEILPVKETTPLRKPNSPYGNTKKISEEIIEDFSKNQSFINAISLRYFNPIGAHPSALIGELPKGVPDNLIPYITQSVYGIRDKLKVFGNDYNTPDGTCIRDYIYVVDLVKAHIVALKRLLNNKNKSTFEVFNLGTGQGLSVLQIINGFESATGLKVDYVIAPRRAGDIEKVWADPSLANKELKWNANTPLNEILLSAWNWEKNYRENLT